MAVKLKQELRLHMKFTAKNITTVRALDKQLRNGWRNVLHGRYKKKKRGNWIFWYNTENMSKKKD